jgi:hypothetical protein
MSLRIGPVWLVRLTYIRAGSYFTFCSGSWGQLRISGLKPKLIFIPTTYHRSKPFGQYADVTVRATYLMDMAGNSFDAVAGVSF